MPWDHKERLRQLRRVVEAAPDDRFDMRDFSHSHSTCGTARCAAGWAAVDRRFQQNTEILDVFDLVPSSRRGECYVEEKDDLKTFDSLAELFGLSGEDTTRLFGGNLTWSAGPVPKAEVLANIDRLLAGQPAESYAAASYDHTNN